MGYIETRNEKIKYIEGTLKRINEFAKKDKPVEYFKDRLTLLLLVCNSIEEGCILYREERPKNIFIEPIEFIRFDYVLSQYANRCYLAAKNMIEYYLAYKEEKKEIKSIPRENIELLLKYRISMQKIAARWSVERFIELFDEGKAENKKKLPRRLPLLKDVMPCFDRLLAVKMGLRFPDNFNIRRLVVCVPPSSGKTYCANVYTVLMLAHHQIYYKETGMIRMTNTADNALNYGSQVYKMMMDGVFTEVFPEFEKYRDAKRQVKMFTYESKEKYLLKDCASECTDSIFMFGVEASINGKRAMLGSVMDDLSGGIDDMDNDELHRKITDKVMSDVLDRSDDDDSPVVIMGTMYNENDVQNAFIGMWERKSMRPHPKYKNVRVTEDGTCATCLVDVEDGTGHTVAPLLYPDIKLEEKRNYFRNRGKDYVYNLVYRQHKDSREPKTFGYDVLPNQYDTIPKHLLKSPTKCFIDTTRKNGSDYFSQPFLAFNERDGKWWLIDAVFEQKSLGMDSDPYNEFRDKVCKRIISNRCVETCIESNTSNTTTLVLKDRCKEMGYTSCKFRNHYTAKKGKSSSKIVQILNMEESIKNNIVFPSENSKKSPEMYQFMQQFTHWNSKMGQVRANPDDSVDSIAKFCEEFIYKKQVLGTIKPAFSVSDMFGVAL